ncbi:MAG: hypothetical protein KatS3mg082_2473 [Nitrospiraceae bacterium]|nr:MAG: hypothetical protein KatS3mg082_2473 [Nitrospiraceae bacterium]
MYRIGGQGAVNDVPNRQWADGQAGSPPAKVRDGPRPRHCERCTESGEPGSGASGPHLGRMQPTVV